MFLPIKVWHTMLNRAVHGIPQHTSTKLVHNTEGIPTLGTPKQPYTKRTNMVTRGAVIRGPVQRHRTLLPIVAFDQLDKKR